LSQDFDSDELEDQNVIDEFSEPIDDFNDNDIYYEDD
jgi:hypothetical protein